ncbi:uncharacterized protein METZ01_LOCUS210889 [marine metagenome]|uniref:Histidine phosphatase family protein n=1 Tax=marine metagenome TaxID=408172 RepID=A0A382F5R0_9ZZZZ
MVEKEDGAPADPPLSDKGRQQAELMANWLADTSIDYLYTSPMLRARETAAPLGKVKNLKADHREGVAEFDRDSDHYIPSEQLKEIDFERWQRLMRGEVEIDFPDFCRGVAGTLNEIAAGHRGETIAVTCHGGVINAWACHVLEMEPRMFFNPNYTSISRFMVASSGQRSVKTLNEHTHLE